MSGHFICESCGYDGGDHAKWCREMRPADERWKGNKTRKDWHAVGVAYDAIRDAFDRPDIYGRAASPLTRPKEK